MPRINPTPAQSSSPWLQTYYFTPSGGLDRPGSPRRSQSAGMRLRGGDPPGGPIRRGDAFANYLDAQKSGGLRSNPSQALNLAASVVHHRGRRDRVRFRHCARSSPSSESGRSWPAYSSLSRRSGRWRSAGANGPWRSAAPSSALAWTSSSSRWPPPATPPSIVAIAPYAAFGAFYFPRLGHLADGQERPPAPGGGGAVVLRGLQPGHLPGCTGSADGPV